MLHMTSQGRKSASVLLLAVEIGPKFNCRGGSGSAAADLQSTEYILESLGWRVSRRWPLARLHVLVTPGSDVNGWSASSDQTFCVDDLCWICRILLPLCFDTLSLSLWSLSSFISVLVQASNSKSIDLRLQFWFSYPSLVTVLWHFPAHVLVSLEASIPFRRYASFSQDARH